MKKITYQITLDDDAYVECLEKLGKLMLFPANGNMTFKVEDNIEDESQAIIVDGIMELIRTATTDEVLKAVDKAKGNA